MSHDFAFSVCVSVFPCLLRIRFWFAVVTLCLLLLFYFAGIYAYPPSAASSSYSVQLMISHCCVAFRFPFIITALCVREGVEEKRKHRYFEAKLEMSSTPAEQRQRLIRRQQSSRPQLLLLLWL